MNVHDTLSALLDGGTLDLPLPGAGRTRERHLRLFDIARRHPVSVARLGEAHTDAVAILAEAGREPQPNAVYGVWASAGPNSEVRFEHASADVVWSMTDLVINGTKPFASGLGVVHRALVTTAGSSGVGSGRLSESSRTGPILVDVDVGPAATMTTNTHGWSTDALRDSATGAVTFTNHRVDRDDIIGTPGWYLDRVGFWHGACGPAACWAGAAAGLVDAADVLVDENPHRRAHLGALRSHLWALEAVLAAAGDEIDAHPHDIGLAHRRALALRHHVERTVADVLDRFGRAFGPRPFVEHCELNQRWLDTQLYTRQDHGERDLEALGRLADPVDAP